MTESIYKGMSAAVAAGETFLASAPDLRFLFQTNAKGGLDYGLTQSASAKELINVIDDACGGLSQSSANEAFVHVKEAAIQAGRIISHYKRDGAYFTEISPVMN